MRSLFGFLFFVTVLIGLAVVVVVPAIVAPMVASAVRAASPFGAQPLDVQVKVDALGLIRGFVGEIRISGTDLQGEGATIGSLAITVTGVGIGDHAFASIEGTLRSVEVSLGGGDTLEVDQIALSGGSPSVAAAATFDRDGGIAFIERAIDAQGVAVTGVELIDGGVAFVIFEQRVEVALGVEDGVLVVPDLLGAGSLELLAPEPGDPWRLTGVSITPGGLQLDALVDAAELLATP